MLGDRDVSATEEVCSHEGCPECNKETTIHLELLGDV